VCRAVAAIAVLGTTVVGLPLLLLRFAGSPLPSSFPSLTQVGDRLLQPDSGQLLLSVLLWIAWLGWACFTASVIAEVAAQLRNHATPRLPGLGSVQQLVGGLVAAAILVLPSHPVTFADAAPQVGIASSEQAPSLVAPSIVVLPPPAAAQVSRTASKMYVVQPPRHGHRDSLWSIAERHLGDPLRWREIAELNRGHLQRDGRRLEDPHWIYPGWRLLMPADATGLRAPEQPPSPPPTADTGQDSETLPVPKVTPDPASNHVPGLPGQAPSVTQGEPAPVTEPPPSRSEDAAGRDRRGQDDGVPMAALFGGGGGLLAAGFLVALARLRIRQRRRRPTGGRMPRPTPELVKHEVHLRVLAETDDREFLDLALRSLSFLRSQESAGQPTRHPPEIHAARLTPDALELFLPSPDTDPPPPYTASSGGHIWSVAKTSDLPVTSSNAGDVLAPYPALVPIGRDEDGLVLIDLEGVGSVAITGDPGHVRQMLHWVAAELALGGWSDYVHATGLGLPQALHRLDPERLDVADVLDEKLLASLEHRAFRDVLSSRSSGAGEAIMPELLLMARPPGNEQAIRLREITGQGQRTGIGVLVAGDWSQAAWTLNVTADGHVTVPGFDCTVLVNRLDDAARQVLAALLASAEQPAEGPARPEQPGETSAEVPMGAGPTDSESDLVEQAAFVPGRPLDHLDETVAAWFDDSRTDVARVKIMGTVRVTAPGTIEPNRVTVCKELITYMATHGKTVEDPAQFDVALWPEHAVRVKTRTQAIVRARAWLGDDAHGEPRLSVGHGGEVHLGPSVLLDWDIFEQLARRGMAAGPAGAEDFATALRLVRGKPFQNLPAHRYAWVAETFLEHDIPVAVVDVALKLAELRRHAGDLIGAREAARTAQLADRYDERPWRDLLESEHALGNTSSVRSLVSDLMTTLELEVEDELDPETNDVISRVLPRRRTAS